MAKNNQNDGDGDVGKTGKPPEERQTMMTDTDNVRGIKVSTVMKELVINHTPVYTLAECLKATSAARLRMILGYILCLVDGALPSDEYIRAARENFGSRDVNYTVKAICLGNLKSVRKKELTAESYRLLSDPRVSQKLMLGMGAISRYDYDEAVRSDTSVDYYRVNALICGLMYAFVNTKTDADCNKKFIVVPDELKAAWKTLTEEKIRQSDTIEAYVTAAVNFYGVIPADEMIKLIRRYDKSAPVVIPDCITESETDVRTISLTGLTDDEIYSAIHLRSMDHDIDYLFRSDEDKGGMFAINMQFFDWFAGDEWDEDEDDEDDENEWYDPFEFYYSIREKPRYTPPKREFILYADPDYYERTPQMDALRAYIKATYTKELAVYVAKFNVEYMRNSNEPLTAEEELDDMMIGFHNLFSSGGNNVQEIIDMFEARNIEIGGVNAINKLIRFTDDAHNNTCLWHNKGYTPNGLIEKMEIRLPFRKEDVTDAGIMNMIKNSGMLDENGNAKLGSFILNTSDMTSGKVLPMPDVGVTSVKPVKVGRNDMCPCGSGKKYKHCCGKN